MRWRTSLWLAAVLFALSMAACVRRSARRSPPIPPTVTTVTDSAVRVAISIAAPTATVSATSVMSIVDSRTGDVQGSSREGVSWLVRPAEKNGIEFSRDGARAITIRDAAVVVRADGLTGFVMLGGRRFRGTLSISREGDSLLVVNHLAVEDYLRGVVPLEIGARRPNESEAIAAQAIAARSFTYSRVAARRRDPVRRYDLIADVSDQVYGGVDSEVELATQMVTATTDLVLKFGGRPIEAVYSSSCGGATADAAEVWAFGGQPYLRSVSDTIPGSTGTFCGIAPRYSWTVTLNSRDLVASLDAYLKNYVKVNGKITWVEKITASPKTPSGRVGSVTVATNTGSYQVTGDKIRFVLRPPSGEILRSTMFDMIAAEETGAGVVRFEARGSGYGHGVGMCQWGAIGRARAGQQFAQILGTYYPGTKIESISARSD